MFLGQHCIFMGKTGFEGFLAETCSNPRFPGGFGALRALELWIRWRALQRFVGHWQRKYHADCGGNVSALMALDKGALNRIISPATCWLNMYKYIYIHHYKLVISVEGYYCVAEPRTPS